MALSTRKPRKKKERSGAKGARQPAQDTQDAPQGPSLGGYVGIFLAFALVGLIVYGPALDGKFISDDDHYVAQNPYVQNLNVANLIAIWDPTSVVTVVVENYAPVHLMLHGVTWQLFGADTRGHHVVNVLLHALAALLLIPLYRRSRVALIPAVLGAALFLVHPANVESVAWISQLKSASALVLSLCALLAHPRRPLLALVLFTLALFAKPFSAFALIVLALFGWMRGQPREAEPELGEATADSGFRWAWLGGWLVVVLVFALIETAAFSKSAGSAPALYADAWVRFGTIFSVALRYLLMAASGTGLSTFHEPPPVSSPMDPWLVLGLLALVLLGWRVIWALRRRSEEAVYWIWALISFAPLSGIVPLPYPMADRYLYFVLPGLIGALLVAWPSWANALTERLSGSLEQRVRVGRAATALCCVLLLVFAATSYGRAGIFQSADQLMADAERNYPEGVAANTRKASRAARRGDFEAACRHLRAAQERGYNRLDHLLIDPSYGPMQGYPAFVEIKNVMADDWIGRLVGDTPPSQVEARAIAQAYVVKDDFAAALEVIEAAIEVPGPITDELRGDAEQLKAQLRLRARIEARRRERAGAERP
jgi:hypothetical protein